MSWSSRKGAIRRSSRDQDWVRVKPFVCGGTGELGKLPGVAVAENERDLAGNGLLDNLSGDGLFNFRKSASETIWGKELEAESLELLVKAIDSQGKNVTKCSENPLMEFLCSPEFFRFSDLNPLCLRLMYQQKVNQIDENHILIPCHLLVLLSEKS